MSANPLCFSTTQSEGGSMISTADREKVNALKRVIETEEIAHEARMDYLWNQIAEVISELPDNEIDILMEAKNGR